MTSVSFVDYGSLELYAPISLTEEDLCWRLGLQSPQALTTGRKFQNVAYAVRCQDYQETGDYVLHSTVEKWRFPDDRFQLSELPLRPVLEAAVREQLAGSEEILAAYDTVEGVLGELDLTGVDGSHPAVQTVATEPILNEWTWNLQVIQDRMHRWSRSTQPSTLSEYQLDILRRQFEAWVPDFALPESYWEILYEWAAWFARAGSLERGVRSRLVHHDCARIRRVGFRLSGDA